VTGVSSYHVLQVLRPMQGGMRRHVLDLIAGLLDEGHQVTIAGPKNLSLTRDLSAQVLALEIELVDGLNPLADWKAVRQLLTVLRRDRYDLVHLHGAKAGYIGRMALKLANPRPPVIYTVHNQVLPQGGMIKRVMNVLERRLAADTDRVITVSNNLQQEVCRTHGIDAARAVTIHNGVDAPPPLSRRYARTVLGCEFEGAFVIGAIGRMVPEKGFDTLIDAFTQLLGRGVEAELVLIGDGPYLSDYQKQAGKIGLSSIRFVGEVPNAARLLPGFDLLAQPSHAEGLGLVPIEAMIAGCPVVASEVGGLPEVVVHGETGLLVPPRDAAALADALQALIQNSDLRERLARTAKQRAEALFSREGMIEATLREYKAVLASREGVLA
jgi:glycosyltransferase involved in cell wall biosynthesis